MKDTDASVASGRDCGAKLSDSKLLVRVLGFVANIEDYMLAAHVLVSKAGLPRSLSLSLYLKKNYRFIRITLVSFWDSLIFCRASVFYTRFLSRSSLSLARALSLARSALSLARARDLSLSKYKHARSLYARARALSGYKAYHQTAQSKASKASRRCPSSTP